MAPKKRALGSEGNTPSLKQSKLNFHSKPSNTFQSSEPKITPSPGLSDKKGGSSQVLPMESSSPATTKTPEKPDESKPVSPNEEDVKSRDGSTGEEAFTRAEQETEQSKDKKPDSDEVKHDAIPFESTGADNNTKSDQSKNSHVAHPNTLQVIEKIGKIFDAPDNTVIIHACNCVGNWGAGIAAEFKRKYPNAFKIHNAYCRKSKPEDLVATAQLIPPSEIKGPKHWVGCLFTSARFGKRRDRPERILEATTPAMEALMKQISDQIQQGKEIGELRTCQINSGLFGVPWESSKKALEQVEVDGEKAPREVTVYSRELVADFPSR